MPELPEVETVVRDLRPQLSGRRIESLQVTRDQLVLGRLIRYPTARQFVQRLRGRTITSVTRRGKYIVMPLQDAAQGHAAARRHEAASPNGAGAERLIVHLGMTGHLRLWEPGSAGQAHARAPAARQRPRTPLRRPAPVWPAAAGNAAGDHCR